MLKVLSQVDVKNKSNEVLNTSFNDLSLKKSLNEIALEKYVSFFKKQLFGLEGNIDNDFKALEIVNDSGLVVSEYMNDFGNFKVCHASLVETLLNNPLKLSGVKLIHAVMPFDEVYPIVQMLSKVPEVSNADTRVILGAYDNYEEDIHEQNRRVLRGMMNALDFCNYCMDDIDGTSLKMVYSTYQKNLKMRR